MSIQVKIPALGESISEVVIAKWLKKEGDLVKMDEVLCELETDKATMELNAEQAGRLHIVEYYNSVKTIHRCPKTNRYSSPFTENLSTNRHSSPFYFNN